MPGMVGDFQQGRWCFPEKIPSSSCTGRIFLKQKQAVTTAEWPWRKEGGRKTTSHPTFCGEWRLQWDLSVEILLPKCHQKYSLCLAAGGDVSLHSYLSGQAPEESQLSMLACFLIYHSVPTPGQLAAGGLEGESGIGIRGTPGSFH